MPNTDSPSLWSRVRMFFNVFRDKKTDLHLSGGTSVPRHKVIFKPGTETSIVNAIFTRIAVDVASLSFNHVRVDPEEPSNYEVIDSALNECVSVEANVDQTASALIIDAVISLLDEGVVAITPVDTFASFDPSEGLDISTMRVGKIVDWKPRHVKVRLWNDDPTIGGRFEDVVCDKTSIAIVENPFSAFMAGDNSVLRRLIEKLNILDAIDKQSGSGRLDLILQLGYSVKTEDRKKRAEQRREEMESQLADSRYGVAYSDPSEKIIQLNRPTENQLMNQIVYLTGMLYSQLGMTPEILSGSADEATMRNYFARTVIPIARAIAGEFTRKFITPSRRKKGEKIIFVQNSLAFVTLESLGSLADSLTRNEIVTGNEMRFVVGLRPRIDPRANQLTNKNISSEKNKLPAPKENAEDLAEKS